MSQAVSHASVSQDAERAEAYLRDIHKGMRDSIWTQAQGMQVPLTPPQVHALTVLVDDLRAGGSGLSLSELSTRMRLAHSTVSGIVTRLQRRGLLRRTERPDDRRFLRIELTAAVRDWIARDLPTARLQPLATAFAHATKDERAAILSGLETLHRLLSSHVGRPTEEDS
jgi:DNA-binding MarR family transcriptional regulator